MDNFHFIDIKPTIDRAEAASIKDAIFRRAREKAQQLTEEKSDNYTSQVQNDVMEIARESIQASPMNPFSQFMENVGLQNKITEAVDKVHQKETIEKAQPKPEVQAKEPVKSNFNEEQFVENFTREVKRNIESASNSAFVKSVQEETMAQARNQFRTNLNYTLSFLNTQAAIKAAEDAHSKINFMI
ncbi:MAG: hypothetical protein K6E29_02540 [Cyanobacteria bacterium RUI128]|nr:hypothetical protein [Cyanobacteria bacterium RUI128]